ncbi:MAG TPA: heme biosynthesis protein HemY, partial [Roseovarius sp.]|nr:heme biosynthesis protein HemY [Roseovarius sp.]
VCEKCHHIHAEWVPACEYCQAFDSLSWTTPPMSTVTSSTGVEMLPLIVGALDDKSDDDEAAPETPQEAPVADAEIVEDDGADTGEKARK